MKIIYSIEPDEPVMNESDFLKELLAWAQKENKQMEVVRSGMMPIVKIDDKKYLCKLEPPKRVLGPSWLNTSSAYMSFGFKFIYLYEMED